MRIDYLNLSATILAGARDRFADDLQTLARELELPYLTCHLTIDDDGDLSCGTFSLLQNHDGEWLVGFPGVPADDRAHASVAEAARAALSFVDEEGL